MSADTGLRADDLWIGEMKGVLVDGRRVLVLRLEEGLFAYEDRCAHLGVPLSEGTLEAGVLTCRAHHFQYDARTGAGINPHDVKLAAVPLRVDAGLIVFSSERAGEKS